MNNSELLNKLDIELKNINSSKNGRRAFLLSMPFILSGCSTTKKTRYREGSNKGQSTSLSVRDEERMTREYLPKMEKDYPLFKNNYAQKFITDMGNRITSSSGLEGKPYHYNFRVVDSDQVNAFALPAGEVFVTSGLIKMTASEAELAGVVGHEVGHIQARHTAERLYKSEKEKTKTILLGLGGALLGGAAGFGLAKLICGKKDRECMARIAKYGAMAGGAGGLLIQKYGFMANSREDEMEADRIGYRTSVKAGYDSKHVGKFYEKLLEMERKHSKGNNVVAKKFLDAMSTHPPGKERVKQMRELSKKSSKNGLVSSKSYLKLKKII